MIKKILIGALVFLLVIAIGAELISPLVIRYVAAQELQELGIDDFKMNLSSSRPHLLKALTNNLSGEFVVKEFSSVITFETVRVGFADLGLDSGDFTFTGTISEAELNRFMKAQWGNELDVVLSQGIAGINIPINLFFITLDASIKGVFNVNPNNKVVFDIKGIDISIPGFEQQVEQIVLSYGFNLDFDNIPNIQMKNIIIEEGYLVVTGAIVE